VPKRVLLDEGVPRHLATPLEAAGISTMPYPRKWKQTKNEDLLILAEQEGYDVLITSDKNIYAQQNLRGRNLSIIVLPTNIRREVMERADDLVNVLNRTRPRQHVVIDTDGRVTTVDLSRADKNGR
jgi:predicted nuclease of predicted toxin-antitoxin system